jgi:hypothetical protein
LNTPDSKVTLLQNLGYEMTGARRNRQSPAVTAVLRGAVCTAVGTQTDGGNPPACPLYPVVDTPAGPRILLEIDLFSSPNRSREFLNKAAFERLRKFSASAADDLGKLFAQHQSQVAKPNPP